MLVKLVFQTFFSWFHTYKSFFHMLWRSLGGRIWAWRRLLQEIVHFMSNGIFMVGYLHSTHVWSSHQTNIFIGYDFCRKGFHTYDPSTCRICVSWFCFHDRVFFLQWCFLYFSYTDVSYTVHQPLLIHFLPDHYNFNKWLPIKSF